MKGNIQLKVKSTDKTTDDLYVVCDWLKVNNLFMIDAPFLSNLLLMVGLINEIINERLYRLLNKHTQTHIHIHTLTHKSTQSYTYKRGYCFGVIHRIKENSLLALHFIIIICLSNTNSSDICFSFHVD